MQFVNMPTDRQHLTLPEFKALAEAAAKAGEQVGAVVVPKAIAVEVKAVDGAVNTRQFIASTSDVDRDQDTLAVDGWELGNFNKAGAFLWAHERKLPPIGKPIATWVEDGKLKTRIEFTDQDMQHPHGKGFGHSMMLMYDGGFLKGVSVGFLPIEWIVNESRAGFMPMDFKRQELVEVSAVPIPSNVNALHEARSKGINVAPIIAWAETMRDQNGLWVSKEAINQLLDQAAGEKTISIPAPAKPAADADPAQDDAAAGDDDTSHGAGDYAAAVKSLEDAEAKIVATIERAAELFAGRKIVSPENEKRLLVALDKMLGLFPRPSAESAEPDDVEVFDDENPPITADEVKDLVAQVMERCMSKLTGRLPA